MTYQIITLSSNTQSDGSFSVSGIFWLVAPTNLVVPRPNVVSQFSNITSAQLLLLRNGTVVEQAFTTGLYASGTSLASVESDLQSQYTAAQTVLNNAAPVASGLVGIAYDGSSWTTPTTPVLSINASVDGAALTSGSQLATPTISKSFGVGRIPRVTRLGFTDTSNQTILALDSIEGTFSINTWLWSQSVTTMTIAQSSGVLTLNNNATTATSSYAILVTIKQFQILDESPVICSFKANVKQTTNAVQELGFGSPPISTAATVNNGAFFRINSSGNILAVTSYNGTETVSSTLATISNSTSYYVFMIGMEDSGAHFIVEDSSGIPIVDSIQALPVTTPEKSVPSHLPVFARVYTTGTAGVAPTIKISSFEVWMAGSDTNKPWSHQLAGTGRGALIKPTNFLLSTNNIQDASDISGVTLSNSWYTACTYSSLGGEYLLTMPASSLGANLLGIFGWQQPTPYTLYVTDILIPPPIITTALGGTATFMEWGIGLNPATTNTGPAGATYLMPLQTFYAGSSAASGTVFSGGQFTINLQTPIVVPPNWVFIVFLKLVTAPTTGTFRGTVFINGYHE